MAQAIERTQRAEDRGLAAARAAKPPLGPYTLVILFVGASLVLASLGLVPELFGHGKSKDYPLWYRVGREVLAGGDLYATDGQTAFSFLYPPFTAVLLAPLSLFGRAFSILCIVLVDIASWWAAVKLSDRLSAESGPKAWWVIALPSALSLPFLFDTFNLGQPNLMLLAIMIAGLALLQSGRQWSAGAMFAVAAALKAFPVTILPYLLWRRRWRAAAAMVVLTAVLLLLAPAPFRGFERNLAEVKTWSQGMVFSGDENGFGQRPNWSWKNNSLIAVAHRLLRAVNAEAADPSVKPIYVNLLSLSYRQANWALVGIAGLVGLGFIAALPAERRRTPRSDAAEFGLLICLMTVASPLARTYYFVWLLFPITVLVYRAALEPRADVRRTTWRLLALAFVLFATGSFFVTPHWPQALGSSFWATVVIIGTLVWHMRRSALPHDARAPEPLAVST